MPRCGCQGKPAEIFVGIVVAEVVQQQERIELLGVAEAEGAAQMHAGAFKRGLGLMIFFTGRMDMTLRLSGSAAKAATPFCVAF